MPYIKLVLLYRAHAQTVIDNYIQTLHHQTNNKEVGNGYSDDGNWYSGLCV